MGRSRAGGDDDGGGSGSRYLLMIVQEWFAMYGSVNPWGIIFVNRGCMVFGLNL